jgi:hypothetical protein
MKNYKNNILPKADHTKSFSKRVWLKMVEATRIELASPGYQQGALPLSYTPIKTRPKNKCNRKTLPSERASVITGSVA